MVNPLTIQGSVMPQPSWSAKREHRQSPQEPFMMPSASTSPHISPVEEDLAAQAVPGHGIPSQDPDPAAQIPLETKEAEIESHSALTG
jgi:hypothetical protein